MLDLSLLSRQETYLLGLSGGRDSVCLLHLLLAEGIPHLHLVHLNHQLRGAESDRDEDFVRQLARTHKLPFTCQRESVAHLASAQKQSVETAARLARHRLFAHVAHTTGCSHVLLAHHADDQAETCLFNLLRGSSGIKGMSLQQTMKVADTTLTLLRPLLHTRRATIDEYLQAHGHLFRDDQSNDDPAYTRNRLRHQALPLLSDILQRDIVPALLRAEQTTREQESITQAILPLLNLRDPQGRLFLPRLRELPPALQTACLQQYLSENEVPNLSHKLLAHALTLLSPDGPPAINLPGGNSLRRRQGRLFIQKN